MRFFITHVGPRSMAGKLGVSVAATNFSYNLMSGGMFDGVYSVLPPYVNGFRREQLNDGSMEVKYSWLRNTPLSRLAAVAEQISIFRRIPRGANVWLYNMTSLNAILVKLLRRFKPSVKIFEIILDFTPGDPKAERWLPLINQCDGRISLSTSERFNQENLIIMPGVTPAENESWPKVTDVRKEFLISGQLSNNISLLNRLLPAFSNLPEATLHITGEAPSVAKEYSAKFPNIICHGICDYQVFLDILHRCPFMLSTRDPGMPENTCNFPSKVIEGLLHNRIIVSTIDYPQLGSIRYLKIDADNIEGEITRILSLSDAELLAHANQSGETDEAFSVENWEREMIRLENTVK